MFFGKFLLFSALFSCVSFTGCGSGSANSNSQATAPNSNANSTRTSVEDLALIINIPYKAEDARWKESTAKNKLTAVLRFDEEDTAKIVAEAQKIRPGEPAAVALETWFPSDLRVDGDVTGDENLRGKSYAPDQFLQSPYNSGRLILVDNSTYFILELTVK